MREVSPSTIQFSTRRKEHPFQENFFGTIVRTRYPHKPALHLAQAIGCTERGAQYLIDGKHKITARCVVWVIDQLIERT